MRHRHPCSHTHRRSPKTPRKVMLRRRCGMIAEFSLYGMGLLGRDRWVCIFISAYQEVRPRILSILLGDLHRKQRTHQASCLQTPHDEKSLRCVMAAHFSLRIVADICAVGLWHLPEGLGFRVGLLGHRLLGSPWDLATT